VRCETVDGGDPDVPAGYGALAEENERCRPVEPEVGERVVDLPVEHVEPFARIAGDSEPRGANRARRGRNLLDRLCR
jgi:hypothetical protein